MAQHTVIIPCIADTYNDRATPNTNYGAASLLKMNNDFTGDTLLCFNFNDYNIKRKKIVLAKLYLFFTTIGTKTPLWFIQYPIRNKDTKEAFTSADENVINFNNTDSQYSTASREYAVLPASNSWVANNITALFNMHNVHNYEGDFWFQCYYDEAGYVVHSRENTNPPYIEIVYEDVPPDKPTLTSPIGEYKDSNSIIRFEWEYNSSVGGVQKKFDLQWSVDQSDWTTISETSQNTYYDMPAETLPAGNIYWRVQTYNEYDEASGYSDPEVFYSIAAPTGPVIISVTNNAKPTVSWQAEGQQLYQIQILRDAEVLYDTGKQPGVNVRTHTVKTFLEDGEYIAKLRTNNEYDLWSDWSEYQFVISTTKPDKPILAVQRSPYGLELTIGNAQGEAYIYRDGVPIAKVTGQKYFDHTVANGKEYRYFVRALSTNGFVDSDTIIGVPAFRFGLLNVGNEVIELKYNLNSVPDKSMNCAPVGMLNHYDGRELPVAEMSDNTNITLSLTYFFKGFAKVEKIMEAARRKKTVLYRDKKGLKLYGIISNVAIRDLINGYTVSFTLSATDHKEAVEIT